MIDISLVKTRLETETNYLVEYGRAREEVLQDLINLPILYINYASVESKSPNAAVEASAYNLNGEDLVQFIDVEICTEIENLAVNFLIVNKALSGWTPIEHELDHIAFSLAQGGVIGTDNTRIRWLSRYRTGFPTLNIL